MSVVTAREQRRGFHGRRREYERLPVPVEARRGLASVSAVWLGFPMVLTSAVFGGLIVYSLGFWRGMLAILLGDLVLMGYVGSLSYLAGRTGKNFALIAMSTFGRRGYVVVSGTLATVIIGWFTFQVGLTGSVLASTMGWDERWTALAAGVGYVIVTLLGIRALAAIGAFAAPMYVVLGVTALVLALHRSDLSSAFGYQGGVGAVAMSMGAAVTLVVAKFIDAGTMTADFTRWSRSGQQGFWAAFTAFPLGDCAALIIGGLIVALGAASDAAINGGNFLGKLIGHGGWLVPVAVLFVFVNLGSAASHCLYNGAVGWGQLAHRKMRSVSVILGAVGVGVAVAGVWALFQEWLNLLGIVVPPIGVVLIFDQLVLPRFGFTARSAAVRWESFTAWAIGSAAAFAVYEWAPQLSHALIGMVVAAVSFGAFAMLISSRRQVRQG
jgi:cytosine permease